MIVSSAFPDQYRDIAHHSYCFPNLSNPTYATPSRAPWLGGLPHMAKARLSLMSHLGHGTEAPGPTYFETDTCEIYVDV